MAAILSDLELNLKGEEVPALIAQASEAFKQEKAAPPACPRKQKAKGEPTLFEFCCEEDSMLGQVNEEHGIHHFQLTQRNSDTTCPKRTESLKKLIGLFPGCDLWASIPCGPWSSLQHLNEARLGKEFKEALRKKRQGSRRILRNFISVAEHVLAQGGHIGFEWTENASGWALPELVQFIKRNGLYTVRRHLQPQTGGHFRAFYCIFCVLLCMRICICFASGFVIASMFAFCLYFVS